MFNRRADSAKVRFRTLEAVDGALAVDEVRLAEAEKVDKEMRNKNKKKKKKKDMETYSDNDDDYDEDEITRVKGCATMWHESPEEICEMLKSIFRIDEDYSARFVTVKLFTCINNDKIFSW